MSKAMQSVLNLLNRANTWLQTQIFNGDVAFNNIVSLSLLSYLEIGGTWKTAGGGTAPTAVTVPASGTAYTPSTTTNTILFVSGGTVTGIAINGVATGLTAGVFPMKANDTITFTYTAAPTVYQMSA